MNLLVSFNCRLFKLTDCEGFCSGIVTETKISQLQTQKKIPQQYHPIKLPLNVQSVLITTVIFRHLVEHQNVLVLGF